MNSTRRPRPSIQVWQRRRGPHAVDTSRAQGPSGHRLLVLRSAQSLATESEANLGANSVKLFLSGP